MASRFVLSIALATAAFPASAYARTAEQAPHMAQRLSDPIVQAQVALVAAAMSQMMLDMKIGPLAKSLGAMGVHDAANLPPDARLGDMIGPDARNAPKIIAREMPKVMGQMGAMAGAMEAMLPQLQGILRNMQRQIEHSQRPNS